MKVATLVRTWAALSLLLLCAGCLSEARQTGWAAGYGRSYSEPIAISMPSTAYAITQQFRRAELHGGAHQVSDHFGIDVHAPTGTPVLAAAGGRVVASHWEPGYGHRIEIDHGRDGVGNAVQTNYVHLQKRLVSKGDIVARGQNIATLGATGLTAGGFPHLHFEVLYGGTSLRHNAQDPNLFWINGKGLVTCFEPRHRRLSSGAFKITYPVLCKN